MQSIVNYSSFSLVSREKIETFAVIHEKKHVAEANMTLLNDSNGSKRHWIIHMCEHFLLQTTYTDKTVNFLNPLNHCKYKITEKPKYWMIVATCTQTSRTSRARTTDWTRNTSSVVHLVMCRAWSRFSKWNSLRHSDGFYSSYSYTFTWNCDHLLLLLWLWGGLGDRDQDALCQNKWNVEMTAS